MQTCNQMFDVIFINVKRTKKSNQKRLQLKARQFTLSGSLTFLKSHTFDGKAQSQIGCF